MDGKGRRLNNSGDTKEQMLGGELGVQRGKRRWVLLGKWANVDGKWARGKHWVKFGFRNGEVRTVTLQNFRITLLINAVLLAKFCTT